MPAQMINKKLVVQAVDALRKSNENFFKDSSKKKPLLCSENESPVFLNVQLKKIPKLKLIKMIKVQLPHRLLKDTSEVCLIAGDLDKRNPKAEIEPDILHYKELLEKHDIHCISEVVTLRQLRTEYKPYEAKQKLLAAYDRFLNDNRITECLPKALGRHFFQKKKFPIQIKINTSNLKQQVENALSTSIFSVSGHGNSCSAEVAYLDMDDSEIIENVKAVVNILSSQLPGSWDNVMGVYLKTARSKAVPIYVSYDDPNKVVLENEVEDDSYEIDELSSMPNVNVKVYKSGKVATVRVKKESNSDNIKSEKEDLANDTQTSVGSKENEKDSDSEVITFKKELSKSSVHTKKGKRSKQQTLSNNITCVEDFENDTESTMNVREKKSIKKEKSRQDLSSFENETSKLAVRKSKRKANKQHAPVNNFAFGEDSENDLENSVNVIEKKSKKKEKSSQESFTFENGTSKLAVRKIKSKANKQHEPVNNFACVEDSDTQNNANVMDKKTKKKKKSSQESFTFENDSENDAQNNANVMDKKTKKKKKSSQESFAFENDSENDKQDNVNVIGMKSKKKVKSSQKLSTFDNGTLKLAVQNNKSKRNKQQTPLNSSSFKEDEIEGQILRSAVKRKRDRSLLTEEKTESFLPFKKNKKIEDFQSKKLNGHKENKKGKKKKGNHL